MSDTKRIILIIFVLFLLTIIFFWCFILDLTSFAADGAYLWYPHLSFVMNSIHSGQLPLWNPFDFCGRPSLGDPVDGVFYPFFWPLVFFIKGHALSLLAVEYAAIFNIFLIGVFMFLFYRVLNLSLFSSALSAIIFMFSSSGLVFFDCVPMTHLAWFPLILLFLQKALDQKDYKYALLGSLGLGLAGLYFNPQFYIYMVYAIGSYFLFDLWQRKKSGDSKQELFFSSRLFLTLIIAGFALAAVQFIPVAELVMNSTRASIDWYHSIYNSMNPKRLIGFLMPYFFVEPYRAIEDPGYEEYHLYIGILPLLLSFIGILFSRHPKKKFFIFLFIIPLLYALGKYAPVQPIFYYLLPGLNKLRAPTRVSFVYIFALVTLAGLGMDVLITNFKNGLMEKISSFQKNLFKIGAILLTLTAIATLFWIPGVIHVDWSTVNRLASTRMIKNAWIFLLLLFGSLFLLKRFMQGRIKQKIFKMAVCVLILLDLFYLQTKINSYKRVPSKERYPELGRVNFLRRDPDFFRALTDVGEFEGRDHVLKNNWGSVYGIYNASGYANLPLGLMSDLMRIQNENLLYLLNVKYIIARYSQVNGADLVFSEDGYNVFKLRTVLPRAFFVGQFKLISDREQALIFLSSPDFDPWNLVVLDEKPPAYLEQEADAEGGLSTVKIDKYTNNEIDVSADAGHDGFLVFSEVFYPGWNAYVDGVKSKIYRANYAFRALYLRRGGHHIKMVYEPLSFYAGLAITLISILILLAYFFLRRARLALRVRPVKSQRDG